MRWKTKEIRELAQDVCGTKWSFAEGSPGGDCDTESVQIMDESREGDFITVCGFLCGEMYEDDTNKSDCDADMIEIHTEGSEEELLVIAARLKARLIKLGWSTTDNLRDYF